MSNSVIQINEVYNEPTFQGEGVDIGKPCFFIRTHNCPVQCQSATSICDTAFTWNGSEKGTPQTIEELTIWADSRHAEYPGCGFVVSGGEPLIHFRNLQFHAFIRHLRDLNWVSLETSGFIGPRLIEKPELYEFHEFLRCFTRVHLSPKITSCLRGPKWTDDEVMINIPNILDAFRVTGTFRDLVLKFVVRDEVDFNTVIRADLQYKFRERWHELMIMPYGIHAEEVIEVSKRLLPLLAKHGLTLTPRLHTLLWGAKRGV